LVTFFGRAKKATRLPAGTGEVKVFDLVEKTAKPTGRASLAKVLATAGPARGAASNTRPTDRNPEVRPLALPDIAIHGCRCPVHWRRYCIILHSNRIETVPNPDLFHALLVQSFGNKEDMS
jgi:hypothetical protein